MIEDYKDPKDLRDISLERLQFEASQLAHQFTEWNNLFNIESAIRTKGKLAPYNYHANPNSFTELEKWSIFSNRFLILDREHLSDYKLFTKEEVLQMIREAHAQGWQDCLYKDEEHTKQHESEAKFMAKKQSI